MPPPRRLLVRRGADAGVAGALLAEQLLGAAGHLAAAQGRVRAGALVGQVHQDDVVQQLLVDLAAELGRIDLDRADRFALAIEHVHGDAWWHLIEQQQAQNQSEAPARRQVA